MSTVSNVEPAIADLAKLEPTGRVRWRSWDPWYEVTARGITLRWADMSDDSLDHGRIYRRESNGHTTICLQYNISYTEATEALTHELIHAERGILFDADTPADVVAAEEAIVRSLTARRLVPPIHLLARLRDAVVRAEPVTIDAVAGWFSVPADTAREALAAIQASADALRSIDLIPHQVVDAAARALAAA